MFEKGKKANLFDLNKGFDLRAPTPVKADVLNVSTDVVLCPCSDAFVCPIFALLALRQHDT